MSLSQPCLPAPSVGLTRILPHLYLGSQKDVLNKVCVQPELEPLLGWSGVGGAGTPMWGQMCLGMSLPVASQDPRGPGRTRAGRGQGLAGLGREAAPCPFGSAAYMPDC